MQTDFIRAIRAQIEAGQGLSATEALVLLIAYDQAIRAQNHNAQALMGAARACREARHVADLTVAVLKQFDPQTWPGIWHFLRAVQGRYSWLITNDVDYQPDPDVKGDDDD